MIARFVKRAADLLVSILLLVVFFPLLLAVGCLVLLKLGKPVLFRQERAGLHGAPFQLIKFRTMTQAVDESGKDLSDRQRMTRFGELLRKASLDELPELWNVVRGDMSLVGPRPLHTRYLSRYTSEQSRRHHVRPGVTGWAQVNGRNAVAWEQRFAMDVWYVDHWALALDARILLLTIGTVFGRRGVSAAGEATMNEFQGPSGDSPTA